MVSPNHLPLFLTLTLASYYPPPKHAIVMTGVTGIALNVATKAELLPELRGDGDGISAADDKTETLQAADAKIPLDCGQGGKQGEGAADEPELDELSERLKDMELYMNRKNTGALTVSILGPYGNLARVTGHVYWDGIERETDWPSWGDRDKGFVQVSHASFGTCLSQTSLSMLRLTNRDDRDV